MCLIYHELKNQYDAAIQRHQDYKSIELSRELRDHRRKCPTCRAEITRQIEAAGDTVIYENGEIYRLPGAK